MLAEGGGGGTSSADSALPWVLIEDGTSKQVSSEERSVTAVGEYICPASVYQL